MGIKSLYKKIPKFLKPGKNSSPSMAAYSAYKKDGDVIGAILDPSGKLMKQPLGEHAARKQFEEDKKKRKKKATGMKAGGQAKRYCRGGGAATRGMRFRKDG